MKTAPVMVLLFIIAQIVGIALLAWFVIEAGLEAEAQFVFALVIGVVVLMTTIFILASGFSQLNLTDPRYALGLPEGSIRAMIALILILVFIMFGSFLYNQESTWTKSVGPIEMPIDAWLNLDNVQSAEEIGDTGRYAVRFLRTTSEGSSRLAQQLLTTVGTLVVAVAGFYFGSATFASGAGRRNRETGVDPPVIETLDPQSGLSGSSVTLTIRGQNFREPTVRLVRNGERLTGVTVEHTAAEVKSEIVLNSESYGPWDLAVENADGGRDRKPRAFELQKQP